MTESQNACPTSEQLKTLLDGSLTKPEQAAMQGHVDGCAACQQALEALVAGSESWDAAVGHLREETPQPDDVKLAEVLQNMKRDEFVDDAWRQSAASAKPLDFLETSDRPGSIGRLGVYEVSEVVGQGGMGVVLKAFDPSLHRVVAVKVLAPYLAHNPLARKRFIREAQAIAAVCHDHVITIHAIDESAEQPKIVMQFISGMSLQEKLDTEGSLDLKEILRIGMQTASGLAAAHAQGLVHRDVKPSNILLENGIQRVKLTDFGLARAVDDASLTQSGVIAGTPQYMAPEQANGDAVDYRADLFSLGSVMYAMCVGHSPFRASTTMGVLKRVCHDPPRPIQELNPDIPDWLCAIVMKLLAKQPGDRFQSAKSVAEVLEKWLAHVQQPSVIPRPVPATESTFKKPPQKASRISEFFGVPSSARLPYAQSDDNVYASTIFFQPISGRGMLFCFSFAMALVFAYQSTLSIRIGLGEAILVSVLFGIVCCAWSLLLLALARFILANVYRVRAPATGKTGHSTLSPENADNVRPRSGWWLPPESMATLAALGTMVIGGHFLVAASIAIVVWRVAVYYARAENRPPVAMSADEATRISVGAGPDAGAERSSFAARFNSVLNARAIVLRRLGESVGSLFDLEATKRNRHLIAISWRIVGGFDLLLSAGYVSDMILLRQYKPEVAIPWSVFSLGMSLLSFAVAHCISVRQNLDQVRGASVIGLLPVSPVAMLRIPLSIITLLWQHAPSVRATFATTPWPETDLGRLVGGQWSQSALRWLGTFGRIAAWSVLCLIVLILMCAFYVIPFGPSDYQVYDASAQSVVLKGDGPQVNFSMMATGTGRTYGLLPPSHTYLRDTILLTAKSDHLPAIMNRPQLIPGFQIRLGNPATTNKGGRQTRPFTKEHCQELFQEISGKPHPQHADSLFQTIQWINADRDRLPSSQRTPAEQFQSGSSISVAEWMSLLSRTFLHAEPLHANRPLPGFVATSTLLNQELFDARPGPDQKVSNSCMTAAWLLVTLLIGFPLVWLLGVWRIVARRHRRQAVPIDDGLRLEIGRPA